MKNGPIKEMSLDPDVFALIGREETMPDEDRLDESGCGWGTFEEWAELLGAPPHGIKSKLHRLYNDKEAERRELIMPDDLGRRCKRAYYRIKPRKRGRGRKGTAKNESC